MIFKGDLTKSNPPDLLMFIAQMGKEGLLNVNQRDRILNISIKNGKLVDAYSDSSDLKLLRMLFFQQLLSRGQLLQLKRAKEETKMPMVQILENMDLVPLEEISETLEIIIKEVIFEFFLWDSGQFHFTDIIIDNENRNTRLDCMGVILDVTTKVDEYREIVRTVQSLDRVLKKNLSYSDSVELTKIERTTLRLVNSERSIQQILTLAPFSDFETLKTLNQSLNQGWISIIASNEQAKAVEPKIEVDSKFGAFKRSFRKLLLKEGAPARIEQVVNYCKQEFDQTLILTIDHEQLIQVRKSIKDKNGLIKADEIVNIEAEIQTDPVFKWVNQSGIPFFGRVFPSNLLANIIDVPADGECAVIPLFKIGNRSLICYVYSQKNYTGISPFQYLELMAWQISPPKDDFSVSVSQQNEIIAKQSQKTVNKTKDVSPAELLVRTVNELPPMPHIVNEILKLLSNPDTSLNDLTEVMANDQALVARIIRVSNSALYGGRQEISTLKQAVTRLGLKLIRSLVLVSSVRSFFPKSDPTNLNLGQALWKHSTECGMACRRIGQFIRYDEPDEALVAGILHDIGKLVILLKLPDKYREIKRQQSQNQEWSIKTERDVLGFDHIEVGIKLMKKWKIPTDLLSAIRLHHKPDLIKDNTILPFIVALGDYYSHKCGVQNDEEFLADFYDLELIMKHLKLSTPQMEALGNLILEDFRHANIFD